MSSARASRVRSTFSRLLGASLGVLFALGSRRAEAAPPGDALSAHLDIDADPSCVPRDRLEARVRQRSQRLRFVEAAPDVPLLRVRVEPLAGQSVAVELQVTRPGGRRSARRLRARSCEDALDATALVIAITLDESASVEALPPEDISESESASAPGNGSGGGAGTANAVEPKKPSAATGGGATDGSSDRTADIYEFDPGLSERSATSAKRVYLGVGIAGHVMGAPAPMVLPGLGVFVLVGWRRTGFSPALRVSLVDFFGASLDEPAGTATFGALGAVLDLCPLGLRTGPLTLRACAEGVTLALSAEGENTFSPRSRTRPYVALGGSLVGSLDLGERVGLVGSAALAKNLVRDTFAFSPSIFYRVPSANWDAALGIELRFP